MQTDKSKRKGKPTSSNKWLAIGAGGIIAVVAMLIFISRPTNDVSIQTEPDSVQNAQIEVEGVFRETITLPLDSTEPIATVNDYSGLVRLVITGIGQLDDNTQVDAFYDFSGDATATTFLHLNQSPARTALAIPQSSPAYEDTHTYILDYDVGEQPREIQFSIDDSNFSDNSGELQIAIYWGVSG